MIHERSTGVKDDTKSFDLNNGKMELSLTERGRTEEGVDILNAKFEMLSDIQIETSSSGGSQAEDTFQGHQWEKSQELNEIR